MHLCLDRDSRLVGPGTGVGLRVALIIAEMTHLLQVMEHEAGVVVAGHEI